MSFTEILMAQIQMNAVALVKTLTAMTRDPQAREARGAWVMRIDELKVNTWVWTLGHPQGSHKILQTRRHAPTVRT